MAEENIFVVNPGSLGLILKDQKSGMEVREVFPSCPFKDIVGSGDIIKFVSCCGQQFTSIAELCKFPQRSSVFRLCRITPVGQENNRESEEKVDHSIYEIKVPAGPLGLTLNAKHVIVEILPTNSVGNKVHVMDRIISINGHDVRDVDSDQIVQLLLATSKCERFIGIQPMIIRTPPPIERHEESQRPPPSKRQKRDDDANTDTNNDLPYNPEDLPPALRNLELPESPFSKSSLTMPGERLAVKKAIMEAYTWHESIKKLEKVLPQTEDCEPAHSSMSALIAEQKRKRDAILLFEEEKLTHFERHLRTIVKYKMEHGSFDHLNANKKGYPPSYALHRFRYNYRKHKEEKEKSIGPKSYERKRKELWDSWRNVWQENFQILKDFGVVLDVPVKKVQPYGSWDDNLERLKRFKEREGHCKVPQMHKEEDGSTLGFWVARQRKHYHLMCCGKKSSMNQDRISKLEAVGFIWKTRHRRQKKQDAEEKIGLGYDGPEEDEKVKENYSNTGVGELAYADTSQEEQVNYINKYTSTENIARSDTSEEGEESDNEEYAGVIEAATIDSDQNDLI